eukprot:904453-Amphidinium_carterae.1
MAVNTTAAFGRRKPWCHVLRRGQAVRSPCHSVGSFQHPAQLGLVNPGGFRELASECSQMHIKHQT